MTKLEPYSPRRLVPRRARSLIETALADTRVVLVSGPRQSGKSTLAQTFASPVRPYLTLDDAATLQSARIDPVGFVRGLDRAVIDEIQRAPELMLAIKESVDRDQRSGRFLLTGSTNLTAIPSIADSLAGRMEIVRLLPFAQAELRGEPGRFLERLFAGEQLDFAGKPVFGDALVDAVLRGGYPEAVRRATASRRRAWYEDYIALILDRDVRDVANIDQLERMPRLLSVLAEHAGQLVNHASFGTALSLSRVTAQKYVAILERLFLIRTIEPWSTNELSRLIKTAKLLFLDSGLLATLRGADAEEIQADRSRFGPLLESFVGSELLKLASWSERHFRISHFRTREQEEVDFVLEDRRGRILGIEVKASATVRPKDLDGLKRLQKAAGDRFLQGILLHDHDRVTPFGEKLHAAPISHLWTM